MRAELVLDCKNEHGEGVYWNPTDGLVWWTDIKGCALWSYDPVSKESHKYNMSESICCFAPRREGGLIIAYTDRIALNEPGTNEETTIFSFETDNPHTRLNDGKTDRQGRFIVGGMNEGTGEANSSVVCVDTDLSVKKLFGGLSCANSICFSPDGRRMYFADTPDRKILVYDYDTNTGLPSNPKVYVVMDNEPGLPDGSCIDAEGGLWNAEWEGHCVVRVAPDGTIDCIIEVPVWKPTCCAFGGPNLDTLFITSSRLMSDNETLIKEPESGGLFAVKPGVTGVLDTPFHS